MGAAEPPNTPLHQKMGDGIPTTVWALGLVSMFMDISSGIIHSIAARLSGHDSWGRGRNGGPHRGRGRGDDHGHPGLLRALNGWLGRRKALALAGYGLGALSKPLFAMAPGMGPLSDRIGRTGLMNASLLADWMWRSFGAPATFFTGTALAAVSLTGFLALHWRTGLVG